MNRRFVKKPLEIEAFCYWFDPEPEWFLKNPSINHCRDMATQSEWIEIETLEGTMIAHPGDYIIKGIKDEIYPCKPEIFESSYDEIKG